VEVIVKDKSDCCREETLTVSIGIVRYGICFVAVQLEYSRVYLPNLIAPVDLAIQVVACVVMFMCGLVSCLRRTTSLVVAHVVVNVVGWLVSGLFSDDLQT